MHTAHYVRACACAPKCVHVLRVLIVTEGIRYEYYTWPSIVPYIPWPTRSRLDSCARRNERGASLAAKVTETARTGAAVGRGRERFSSIWRRCMAILAHRVHTYTPRHAVVCRVYTRLVGRCACVPQRRRVVDPHGALCATRIPNYTKHNVSR